MTNHMITCNWLYIIHSGVQEVSLSIIVIVSEFGFKAPEPTELIVKLDESYNE